MKQNTDHTGRGILKVREGTAKFELTRYEPVLELKPFVKHYWIARWDLRNEPPYCQTILSHPNVNMVFEEGAADIFGVSKTTSSHWLKGQGGVFGVKFMPGGFYPFWQTPLDKLVGSSIPASKIFGHALSAVASMVVEPILDEANDESIVKLIETHICRKLPNQDTQGEFVNDIVDEIMENRELTRVDGVANHVDITVRTLQRLFSRYIGVSPKWVIKRYRLHEAAEQLEAGAAANWAELAMELGYYDQAHFIKDFKAIVGKSPADYIN